MIESYTILIGKLNGIVVLMRPPSPPLLLSYIRPWALDVKSEIYYHYTVRDLIGHHHHLHPPLLLISGQGIATTATTNTVKG